MRLLNIGAGPKGALTPSYYADWDVTRLDIEPYHEPDLLMDALELDTLEADQFDAAYGSHILEHFYPSDLERFLGGVVHVLRADGFAEFRVPDALAACRVAAEAGTLEAFCYRAPAGDVTAWDMLYGYVKFQMVIGTAMAHHNGFSQETLVGTLQAFGFERVYVARNEWEMGAIGCLTDLSDEMKRRINLDQCGVMHPDNGRADLEPIRQLRPVAELPLRDEAGGGGNGHSPAAPAAGRRGADVSRGARARRRSRLPVVHGPGRCVLATDA